MTTLTALTSMLLLLVASEAAAASPNKPPAFLDQMQSFMKAAEGHTDHYLRELETSLAPALETLETRMGNTFGQVLNSVKRSHLFGASPKEAEEEQTTGTQVPATRMPTFNEFLNQAFRERFGGGSESLINPFAIFGSQTLKQWYEGPNVCISRKVIEKGTGGNNSSTNQEVSSLESASNNNSSDSGMSGFTFSSHFSSCKDGETFHECTTTTNHDGVERTVTVTHECCYGYKRKAGGELPGCEQMSLKPLRETLKDLKMDGFLGLVEALGDSEALMKQNVTVFVPSNDAIEDFRYDLNEESNAISDDNVVTYSIDDGLSSEHHMGTKSLTLMDNDSLDNIIRGHFVDGFIDTRDLKDEEKIETKMSGSKIRVTVYNTFPEKVEMANCARITSRDHYATNGVAHIVNHVIMPATKTVAQLIRSDVQLVKLREVLAAAGMLQDLDEPEGQFTLFAPTNHAFAQMEATTADSGMMMERLKRGDACSRDILNNHLLPNVICSGIIDSKARTPNMLGKYVSLSKDDQGAFYVNNVPVTIRDIVATNGVLHIVEEVLMPEGARSISKALKDTNRTHLLQLLETAGLTGSLDELSNVTLLAPSEHLLQDHMTEELSAREEQLKQMLEFHTIRSKKCLCDLKNNQMLETVSGDSIRINTFAPAGGLLSLISSPQLIVTAQCKPLLAAHTAEVCGGSIHTISDIMEPSAANIMEAIKASGNHSKFLQLLQRAEGLREQISSTDGKEVFTVLAPSDDAFANLEPEVLEKLEEDKDLAEELVKNHLLRGITCCAGIPRTNGFFDTSLKVALSDKLMSVRRSYGGRLYAGGAKIAACDTMAANGVVHRIDSVILPQGILPVADKDSFPAQTLRSIFSFFDNKKKK